MFDTARDALADWTRQHPALRTAGLPDPDATKTVFQADVLESPTTKPFVVIRWGDVIRKMGEAWVQSVDFWVYDEFGDYSRASNIAKGIVSSGGESFLPIPTTSGCLAQLQTAGDGLGVGGDLADDGFKALVIPVRARAIGRGL
jgi:hypothetical protein